MIKKIPVKLILQIAVLGAAGILVAVMALGFAVLKLGDSLTSGLCDNKVISESVSPDGYLKAVVFSRDCGATTGYSTQVSIIKNIDSLPNEVGNVFVNSEKEHGRVSVTWSQDGRLLISYESQALPLKMVHTLVISRFLIWRQIVEIDYKRL